MAMHSTAGTRIWASISVISAIGADRRSSVLYNRVKGEMEYALKAQNWPQLTIVRPSLLVGDRGPLNQPERPGERIGLVVSKLLKPLIPANYLPVQAEDVAAGLVQAVKAGRPGVQRILSGALQGAATRAAAA